ncbi:hypothetical protein NQ314_013161 [Rhamnusium bicolor]|uniref:Uncharacterized protein n=1 Tax=Rhamnusium bicolor TaxID=1586634 RepID=A0AAV8X848_9CUCU|nr:hypothetical protein NQ314_013161 [Rhamnusium bicolor]
MNNSNMQNYTIFSFIVGIVVLILTSTMSKASVISCPPSSLQEQANPALRQLCFAIEQAVDEVVPQTQCKYYSNINFICELTEITVRFFDISCNSK